MCINVEAWQVSLCVTTLERETSLTDTTTFTSLKGRLSKQLN